MAGRLEFYWYESKSSEEAGTAWGQLAGASHRLHFVCEEIETCASGATVERALERLEYHMENYLVRVYELRSEPCRLPPRSTVVERSQGCLRAPVIEMMHC
jgi:hypothetical protein